MIFHWSGPDRGPFVYVQQQQRPLRSGKEKFMLKSAITLLAVFTCCAIAIVGCKVEGEVGQNASSISAPR
jgi:hypothetical protein